MLRNDSEFVKIHTERVCKIRASAQLEGFYVTVFYAFENA